MRATRIIAPGLVAGLGFGLVVDAPARADLSGVTLDAGFDVRIDGAAANDQAGYSVAGIGDFDGDGFDDMLIGSRYADAKGLDGAGAAYVVFGSEDPKRTVDLAKARVLRIEGAAERDYAGQWVAGAGDVNGDGLADVVVGAHYADANGRLSSGAAYVVYGSAARADVDLADLGARGLRIDGAEPEDVLGRGGCGGVDLNGDGYDDLVIGATGADTTGRDASGALYVVFGSAAGGDVDLASPGARGYRIDGAGTGDRTGLRVADAGDVDGDGVDDVIVGVAASDVAGPEAGASYVVFGSTSTSGFDLADPGDRAWRILGGTAGEGSGAWVDGVGDINRDGYDDVAVAGSGSTHVVFGRSSPQDIRVSELGPNGLRINGSGRVAGLGDVNSDGRPDLGIADPDATSRGLQRAGRTHVLFGAATPRDIDLADLGRQGYRIDGAAKRDYSGAALAAAGDVNADGVDDILVSATRTDNNARKQSGSAYLILGSKKARLRVAARAKKVVPRSGKTKLVRKVSVGPGQRWKTRVTVLPRTARSRITVKTGKRTVRVITRNSRKARIVVRIRATGPGLSATSWKRTWRVR